jgi:hypothetical protein
MTTISVDREHLEQAMNALIAVSPYNPEENDRHIAALEAINKAIKMEEQSAKSAAFILRKELGEALDSLEEAQPNKAHHFEAQLCQLLEMTDHMRAVVRTRGW